jgi:hypothetical protein
VTLRGKLNGAKHSTEAMGWHFVPSVGERSVCNEGRSIRATGADGSENAGMSSAQTRENRVRRKSKVSDARSFRVGLVGYLAEAERRR